MSIGVQEDLAQAAADDMGVQMDLAQMARVFQRAADQGYADAQYRLAAMIFHGKGIAKDYYQALVLYELAAAQGHADAKKDIGLIRNAVGDGTRLELIGDLAEAAARCRLGLMYYTGTGFGMDFAEAARLFRLAAAQGNADAQNALAGMYANGEGVSEDSAEAARLYRLAADQGNADAQFHLGSMYRRGKGVGWDLVEAARRGCCGLRQTRGMLMRSTPSA